LSGEVRIQTGEAFEIFQDRNDIAWGQQWKSRIEDALDAVTFLIPVITPAFFKSVACRAELERFLNREESLGRRDLVLPVYYIESVTLNNEARREQDPLAKAVAARQYADWRELRFEPLSSPEVGRRLAAIAKQIVDALERSQPSLSGSAARARNVVAAGPTEGKGGRTQLGAPERTAGPEPKTQIPTLVVDAFHRGDHSTVTEALEAAKPGTRILVRPGLYKEGLVVDKPVEIVGDGTRADIVLEASGTAVVLFKSSMGRIANLTLRQTGGSQSFAINISQGRLNLEDCDISSRSLSCVGIQGGADPRLYRNRIHDGNQAGVLVFGGGLGTLEDNEIVGNVLAGVEIREGGNVTLRRNRIYDGKSYGVFVQTNGQATLENNEIFGNELAAVAIREGGNATLRRNRIYDGKSGGVFVYENGLGTIEDNEIFGNALAGVEIKDSNPTLRRNRVYNGAGSGIFVHKSGQGTLEDNEIFENAKAGVFITEDASPILRRNRISKNGYEGIWVKEGGGGVFERNDLRGNMRGAWDVAPASESKIKRVDNVE
jgi:F-box protein 11